MWSVSGFGNEDAKIFCLWENSILSILQLIIERTETEGAWVKLHQSQIYNSYILNLDTIDTKERNMLLEVFDEISKDEFPSLVDQLRKRHPLRIKLDKAIFTVLGFSSVQSEKVISNLYPSIVEEIEKLRSLMSG
jgi:hypothetical protein